MSKKFNEHYLEVEKPCFQEKNRKLCFSKNTLPLTQKDVMAFPDPNFTGLEGFRASTVQAHTLVLQWILDGLPRHGRLRPLPLIGACDPLIPDSNKAWSVCRLPNTFCNWYPSCLFHMYSCKMLDCSLIIFLSRQNKNLRVLGTTFEVCKKYLAKGIHQNVAQRCYSMEQICRDPIDLGVQQEVGYMDVPCFF